MLDAFLERMAATPFVDGSEDCVLTIADWIVLNGYPDPAIAYRNRFHTRLGCARFVRRNGGLAGVMSSGAERCGLAPTTNPVRGDVGLINLRGVELAGIFLGARWAFKSRAGLLVEPAEPLNAWRL